MKTSGRRKAFGQHFLNDAKVVQKIIDELNSQITASLNAEPKTKLNLLEVGPGSGAITKEILKTLGEWIQKPNSPASLKIVEMDRQWAGFWTDQAVASPVPTKVFDQDFLEVPHAEWLPPPGEKLGVVSNLPYSSGTAILTEIADYPDQVPFMILMFQKEVAERLRAQPETKAWGSLSLWIQTFWDVTPLAKVPPHAFTPPPQVDSEIVVLIPRKEPRLPLLPRSAQSDLWQSLLKQAFAHRRKMLRSGLPKNSPAQRALETAGISGTNRAEALDWNQWKSWFSALLSS